ncbi:MAG: hypothetical protein ACTHNG_00060 [Ginsengibacter sp.]|jgi:hypothetical protein
MKKFLLIIIAVLGFTSFTMAQQGNGRERIQALKVAFITQKLHLTTAEAEKFWPVYNQYDNEIMQVRANNRNGDVIEKEQKVLDIRKKYRSSFEKILGPQRLNDLYNAESDFRKILIQRLKESRK